MVAVKSTTVTNGSTHAKGKRVPWHLAPPDESCYTIGRVLGQGHYGVVYAATHRQSGEIYALKAIDKSHPEYEFEEVRNEVAVLARICDHPHIANLYEVFETPTHIYLVQEACLGGELFDLVIERKHFTEGDAARAAAVLISILRHCHDRGVIHRDIKPENFLIKAIVPEEGRFNGEDLRAVDFGLSIIVNGSKDEYDGEEAEDDGQRKSEIVGSSYYIAPEILGGHGYSPAADAWSLGVVVFILISGYPPFYGSSDPIIFDRIQHQELDMDYEPWNTDAVSPLAADFVRRLLNKNPTERISLEEAAEHPWLTDAASLPDQNPLAPAIVDRLRAFTRQNRLTCLLMTLVAHHLSDSAIGELRKTFEAMDTDHDGLIGVSDISRALAVVEVDTKAQGLPDLIAGLDVGHTHAGQVNVDEFLAAAMDRKEIFTKTTVNAVFNRLDINNEGKLSMAALSTALAECGIPVPENALRTMMAREGALDGAGVVSARSFQNLLVSGAEVHQKPPKSAAAALERLLSGGLHHIGDEIEDKNWGNVLASRRSLPPLNCNLAAVSTGGGSSRRNSLDSNNNNPLSPTDGLSSGATLDDVLRQYSMSGYRTPRRRTGTGSVPGSPFSSSSPSPLAMARQSAVSTPTSVPSPSIACLGCD